MPSDIKKKIQNLGNEELYEIALDRERMRSRERQSRRHSELLLQGLQVLTSSDTAESGLLNILLSIDRSESLDGSFVLVSDESSSLEVFSSTLPGVWGTKWYPGDMFSRMFERGKPIIVHDLRQPAEWKDKPEIKRIYRSAVHAPFYFGKSRAAIICVSKGHGFIRYMHAKLLYRLGPLLTQALVSIQNLRQLKNARAELEEKSQQLEQALGKATRLAGTDYLTQVLNRRSFFDAAEKELYRSCQLDLPLSVLVLDIDNFKAINDNYGHAAGDAVLADLANLCKRLLRDSDVLARYGGEEFMVLLPATPKNRAAKVAERIQQAVAKASFNGLPAGQKVTISIGVAGKDVSGPFEIATLIDHGDKAMYEAKKQGKNRVVLYPFD